MKNTGLEELYKALKDVNANLDVLVKSGVIEDDENVKSFKETQKLMEKQNESNK